MRTAYIGLGANLASSAGPPTATLAAAVLRLNDFGRVTARSSLYRTNPVGFADQPSFVNAVVAFETALAPQALIKKLLAFESGVKEPPGPIPPIRLLAKWGAVSSIRFVGNRDGGFDLESDQWIDPHNKEEIHWEHYEVKQPGGMSE